MRHGKMARFAALTMAVLTLACHPQELLAVNNAQDFYFVVDTSGSIDDGDSKCERVSGGLTCMELLASFCEATADAMAELVGSYFESPENNGMRVGITLFRCKGVSEEPNVILEPTGNVTLIAKGFKKLAAQIPSGNTCAETALAQTKEWIEEAKTLAPPERTSSVLYVTDGFLEHNANKDSTDRTRSKEVAEAMNELNNTQIFALTLNGALTTNQKERQITEVTEITGDSNLIFPVEDAGSLNATVSSLTSFIFGDFRISLNAPDGTGSICAGDQPTIRVTGASVAGLENLVCVFEMSGVPDYTYPDVPATLIQAGVECPVPQSFFSSATEDEVVTVQLINVEATLRRKIGVTTSFNLARPPCVTVTPDLGSDAVRCIGEEIKYTLSGRTIDALLADANTTTYSVQCQFEFMDDGYAFSSTVDAVLAESGDNFTCAVTDASDVRFAAASNPDVETLLLRDSALSAVDLVNPPILTRIDLVITSETGDIPGTTASSLEYTNLPEFDLGLDYESTACMGDNVPASVCWRTSSQVEADFTGEAVKWALGAAGGAASLDVRCIFELEDAEGAAYGYMVDPSSTGSARVSCALPSELYEPAEDGALRRVLTAGAYLVDNTIDRAMVLSVRNLTSFIDLDACFAVAVEEEPCFGADASVTLTPSGGSSVLLDGSDGTVSCFFIDDIDSANKYEVEGTQVALGDGSFECRTDETVPEEGSCPLTFKLFEIRSNGATVLSKALSDQTSECLQLSARGSADEVFVGSSVSVCWAQDEAVGAAVLFTGKTALNLDASLTQCRFSGGSPVAANVTTLVSASRDASTGGLTCIIPSGVFMGEGNGVAPGLTVQLLYECDQARGVTLQSTLGNLAFDLDILTGAPCLTSSVSTLSTPSVETVCVGEAANIFVDGGSSFASFLSVIDTSVECVFDTGDTVEGKLVESNATSFVSCPLPRDATLEAGRVSTLRLSRTDTNVAEYIDVDLSGYELGKEGSCLSNAIIVDPQTDGTEDDAADRRALQTSSAPAYCLGDGLSTSFSGQSVVALLGRFNETDSEDRASGETVTVLTQWECRWHVDTDWDPSGGTYVNRPIWPNGAGSTITCESEVWSPFSSASFNLGAYSSVELAVAVVDSTNSTVGDPVSFEQGYKAQVCSGDLSQGSGVPDSDADCARAAVELVLGGRSAITLAKEKDRVSCEFDGPSGTQTGSPLFTGGSSPSVECQAPGWEPNSSSGNYTSITLLARVDDGNQTMMVKALDFAPTAGRMCIDVSAASEACVGETIAATLSGTSLGAYRAWNEGSFAGTVCEGSSVDVGYDDNANGASSNETIVCAVRSALMRTSVEEELTVTVKGVAVISFYALEVRAARNKTRCLSSSYSYAQCAEGNARTEVELTGLSLDLVDASNFVCVLTNTTTGVTIETTPQVSGGNASVATCFADDAFNVYSVSLQSEKAISLADGAVSMDNSTCLSTAVTSPPSGSDDSNGSNLGMILGIVFGLLAVLLVILFFIARRRREERGRQGVAGGKLDDDLERGIPAKSFGAEDPALGDALLHNFGIGDRIEAQGDFDESGAPDAWHKGTLVADHHDGRFTVQLDNGPLDQREQIVALAAMQRARSDYSVGEQVEAQYGAGKTWHSARVAKVNKNDTYDLEYEGGSLAAESMVAGGLIRAPLMNLEPGSLVEAMHPTEKRFLRGVVDTRNVPSETYGVQFDAFSNDPASGSASPVGVKRQNVRLFVPAAGDLMDVKRPEDEAPVRAIVSFVDNAAETCTLVDDDTGESLVDVAFAHVFRPVFSVGQAVDVRREVDAENEGMLEAGPSSAWARARVLGVNAAQNTYKVEILGAETVESGVPVARLRESGSDPIPDVFRPPQRDHEELYDEDGQPVPYHLRFKKSKPLAYHELPGNQFDVTVDMSDGLGLSLGWTNDSRVIVAGFRDLPISGSWGPIEATGLVGLKDELIRVNEVFVAGKSFVEVSELIKKSDKIIKLQFGRWDDEGPVSMGMQQQ